MRGHFSIPEARVRFRVLAIATLAWVSPLTAQRTDSLPAGVTAAMIGDGQKIYAGAGLCSACHGPQAKGTTGLGPNLTDAEWLHSNGTFDALVAQITAGVPANKSKSGVAMPPKGGAALTDAQIRAVAAYVWSLGPRATR
jgi:mono/diheme cytochrome c family protein